MSSVSGAATGHPSIRATHRKTLEFVRDEAITARATCVVGVAARIDEDALAGLHGPVELTLSVGGQEEIVRGRLNPAFRPGDPLIVRRADAVTRDALLIGADRAASDLPRSFVTELARPAARIAIRVNERAGTAGPGVLVVGPSAGVLPEGVAEALTEGRRVMLDADLDADAEARAAIHAAHDAGHTVLPANDVPLVDAVRAVGGLTSDAQVTEDIPADEVRRWLRGTRGAVVLDPGTPRQQYLGWRSGQKLTIPGARGRRATVAIAREEGSEDRARELAAGGASTKDVARALQEDAGLPHRRAYELALDLTADTSSVSRPEPRTSR